MGDLLEMRARGKEDSRGGGEDMMVLGTHLFDLMRLLAGDASWCFAQVLQSGKPVTKAQVRTGGEGMGPVAGDQINAVYGFGKGGTASFSTDRARPGASPRFALSLYDAPGSCLL